MGETDATATPVISSTDPLLQRLLRVLAQVRLEHREDLRSRLDEDDPGLLRRDLPVVLREVRPVQLGQRAPRLDPRRAAAHDDDVERAVLDEGRVAVGLLPAAEDVILQAHRIGERVHRERVLGCALGAEEVDLGSDPEDEEVVRHRRQLLEPDLARREIDRRDDVLMNRRVLLVVDEVAQRVANRRRLEEPAGELVQQRLERVVVVLVDEHDVGVGMLQLHRGADPGETSAEDQDPGARSVFALGSHGARIVGGRDELLLIPSG